MTSQLGHKLRQVTATLTNNVYGDVHMKHMNWRHHNSLVTKYSTASLHGGEEHFHVVSSINGNQLSYLQQSINLLYRETRHIKGGTIPITVKRDFS